IGENVLKSMLPLVAAMMMGTMSKQGAQPGSQAGVGASGASLIGMLTPMLDSNRDGSIVDDVVGMIGRFSKRSPLGVAFGRGDFPYVKYRQENREPLTRCAGGVPHDDRTHGDAAITGDGGI